MNQDRHTQYQDIVTNASDYPLELDYLASRLHRRIKKRHAMRFVSSLSAFVGAIVLFTMAVNNSTVFAQVVDRIPIIGDLAEYIKFDQGLQNAVKNKYIQEVNLDQESNGYTLKLPYVIADSKRLVLFFQLPENLLNSDISDEYQISLDDSAWDKLAIESVNFQEIKSESKMDRTRLLAISIRSSQSIPKDITIPVSLVKLFKTYTISNSINIEGEPTNLASYAFKLHLNDYQEPQTTVLNQEVQILEQPLILQSITEYPTGVEIKATAPNKGTEIISDIELNGIDENGNIWSMPENETPAMSYNNDSVDFVYYLENDYFSDVPLASLEITKVGMFSKEEQIVTVDLVNQTMTPTTSDLFIKSVKKSGETANIIFEATLDNRYIDETSDSFDFYSADLQGIQQTSHSGAKTQYFITVTWNENNQVVLTRYKAPLKKLEDPVKILLQ
jgi:Domain of unknown function (DUF4179)